jgi:hypothetical protein
MMLIGSVLQDWNASLHKKDDDQFNQIAKEMSTALRKILVAKPYIAIVDASGTIHYIDTPAFDEFLFFIQGYVKKNFRLIGVGGHSIPFGGISLAFFKLSRKALVILFVQKGPVGQLLAFKPMMNKWTLKLDDLIGDIEITDVPEAPKVQPAREAPQEPAETNEFDHVKRVPLLVKPLPAKKKFPMEVVSVLQYCDGTHTMEEILERTKFPRLKVDLVLREYQKKKFIKIMRLLS